MPNGLARKFIRLPVVCRSTVTSAVLAGSVVVSVIGRGTDWLMVGLPALLL